MSSVSDRLTAADVGEWTLLTAAGRVEVEIRPDGTVAWALARDAIGSFATVPSMSGDACDFPLAVGAVPVLRVERRGAIAGVRVYRPLTPALGRTWRVLGIRPLSPYLPGERFRDGRLVECHHLQPHHEAACACGCGCCRERHVERLDELGGRRVTVYTLNSVYVVERLGGVRRTPDGDTARAQVMKGVAVRTSIVLGEAFYLLYDESIRRSSSVQAIIVEE